MAEQKENTKNLLTVIGVGASAGGVEAIESFFSEVEISSPICYIVLLHCSPTQKSILADLINATSCIPAKNLQSGEKLQAGYIYVVPENRNITITNNIVNLTDANFASCNRKPIDQLFSEIAQNSAPHCAGVILSGTGDDGVQGALKIKQAGGIIATQDLIEAKFSDMPSNLLTVQQVDMIDSARQLNLKINAFFSLNPEYQLSLPDNTELASALTCIFDLLKESTSHDFSSYKHNTLLRRIKRRMFLSNTTKLEDYVALLIKHKPERLKLVSELLIGVTQFFRDASVWQLLAAEVLPNIMEQHLTQGKFRAWVAGCSTGEEVYTLAILIYQLKQTNPQYRHIDVQIFATDLNQHAISFARKAQYSAIIENQINRKTIEQCFEKTPSGYTVKKVIRDMVVFAPHNLLSDPPFTKLDLICCRNVMIYMTQKIHEQLLIKFHYSLNNNGYLLLGTAESVGQMQQHFIPIKNKVSLFTRQALISGKTLVQLTSELSSFEQPFDKLSQPIKQIMTEKQPDDLQHSFEQYLHQHLSPAALLVDHYGKILNILGDTSPYLAPATGKADWHVQAMAKVDIANAVQEALLQAQKENQMAEAVIARQSSPQNNTTYVLIRAAALKQKNVDDLWLITFTEFKTQNILPTLSAKQLEQRHNNNVSYLEKALQKTREEIQHTKEEMQTSREELMSTNEELQSTNEELTTSTEELRTMNEELQIARHQAEQAYLQFADLFNSAPVGYFTLDSNAKILSVNDAGKALLAESNEDQVGSRLTLYIVEQDRALFLQTLATAFQQKKSQYCDVAIWRDGVNLRHVVINISEPKDAQQCRVIINDITERKLAENKLFEQEQQLRKILDNSTDLIVVTHLDKQQNICFSYGSSKFLDLFKLKVNNIINKPLAEIPQLPIEITDDALFFKALKNKTPIKQEIQLHICNKTLVFEQITTVVFDKNIDSNQYIMNLHDITVRKTQQQQLLESEARYARVIAGTNDGIWEWNIIDDITYVSPRCHQLLGYKPGEITETNAVFYSRLHDEDKAKFKAKVDAHIEQNTPLHLEIRLKTKLNKYVWFLCKADVQYDKSGKALLLSGTISNIHQQKLLQHQSLAKNKILEMTAQSQPLPTILLKIIHLLEQDHPEMLCSILLVDESGKHLCAGIGPKLPDFYSKAIEGVPIADETGSCSTAAFRKERVIVENIQTHPYWQAYKNLAEQAQLAACWSQPIINAQGKVLGTFAIYHRQPTAPTEQDIALITNQAILAEIAIEHSLANEKLKMASLVYENSSEASMVFDENDIILSVNPAFTQITGYDASEIIGQNRSILHSNKHEIEFYQTQRETIISAGKWQGELWGRKKTGELYAQWITINTVYDDLGRISRRIALFFDITERKQSEQLIWQQANFDELTGLPNRRMFFDRLQQECKRIKRDNSKLALLLIDLDNFKEVNDTLGHDQGDILLKETTKRIQACVRESDTLARLGGDEFTLIMPDLTDPSCIESTINDILLSLQQGFQLDSTVVYISGSVGITLYPNDGEHTELLLKNADQAMYLAKEKGKNQFSYFTPAMQEHAQTRIETLNDLRIAIKEQQFELYYQPIIDTINGKIIKAEVLIRWNHPQKGLIPPLDFIPLAEESGLITEIGDWVFKTAAKQLKQWNETIDANFSLSINVSPIQFLHKVNQIEQWIHFIAEQNINSNNIVIEITEGLLLDASSLVKSQLKMLAKAGINVSMDDFGTGYSSLSYLKKFDIDFLKIDQSFVKNMDTDNNDHVLCQAIIVMAHRLGLKVIAEGVETEQHVKLLSNAKCDYLQGYFVEKPIPKNDFEAFVKAHTTTNAALLNIQH
jgi:diguanylate cyclase (GGDEF)-like protein/PAS domain S-box-containing protein